MRVLLIDDDPTTCLLVRAALATGAGHTLDEAPDAATGLRRAREGDYDLVLLDHHLPDLDGGRTLARLRQDPRAGGTPIVCLTADTDPTLAARLRAQGARAVITKPFDPRTLARRIEALVRETL